MVHIGEEIEKVVFQRGMSVIELATRIGRTRQTVSSYFSRASIETDVLLLISEALDFDFFQFYVNPQRGGAPSKSASGVSILLNVSEDRVAALLKAAFGDFNGNVLLSHLPQASH